MAINKVVYGSNTLIDLTEDTVTADDVASGVAFHLPDGASAIGNANIIKTFEATVTEDKTSGLQYLSGANDYLASIRDNPNAFLCVRFLDISESTAELSWWFLANFTLFYSGSTAINSFAARCTASSVSGSYNKMGFVGRNYSGHLNVAKDGSIFLWPSSSFPLKAGKYQIIAGTLS